MKYLIFIIISLSISLTPQAQILNALTEESKIIAFWEKGVANNFKYTESANGRTFLENENGFIETWTEKPQKNTSISVSHVKFTTNSGYSIYGSLKNDPAIGKQTYYFESEDGFVRLERFENDEKNGIEGYKPSIISTNLINIKQSKSLDKQLEEKITEENLMDFINNHTSYANKDSHRFFDSLKSLDGKKNGELNTKAECTWLGATVGASAAMLVACGLCAETAGIGPTCPSCYGELVFLGISVGSFIENCFGSPDAPPPPGVGNGGGGGGGGGWGGGGDGGGGFSATPVYGTATVCVSGGGCTTTTYIKHWIITYDQR